MKKTMMLSAMALPLLVSCNLLEVAGDFGNGTAFSEMGTTYQRTAEYTYENYTKHMMESNTNHDEQERMNMMQDAARRRR